MLRPIDCVQRQQRNVVGHRWTIGRGTVRGHDDCLEALAITSWSGRRKGNKKARGNALAPKRVMMMLLLLLVYRESQSHTQEKGCFDRMRASNADVRLS
jgi:hypothetical protein